MSVSNASNQINSLIPAIEPEVQAVMNKNETQAQDLIPRALAISAVALAACRIISEPMNFLTATLVGAATYCTGAAVANTIQFPAGRKVENLASLATGMAVYATQGGIVKSIGIALLSNLIFRKPEEKANLEKFESDIKECAKALYENRELYKNQIRELISTARKDYPVVDQGCSLAGRVFNRVDAVFNRAASFISS